jgi:hypothetical protein
MPEISLPAISVDSDVAASLGAIRIQMLYALIECARPHTALVAGVSVMLPRDHDDGRAYVALPVDELRVLLDAFVEKQP